MVTAIPDEIADKLQPSNYCYEYKQLFELTWNVGVEEFWFIHFLFASII